ncbi:hypothetical protein HMI54_014631 [Coelomomyces lativittatus]|nr:hypothetical protein HMI54_014631 [Coelomomyces lativittatus]
MKEFFENLENSKVNLLENLTKRSSVLKIHLPLTADAILIEVSALAWVLIMEWVVTKRMKEVNRLELGTKYVLKYNANKKRYKPRGRKSGSEVNIQGLLEGKNKSGKISHKGDPSRKQIATLNTNPNSFPAEDLTQRYSSLGIHDSAYVGPLNQIHSKVGQISLEKAPHKVKQMSDPSRMLEISKVGIKWVLVQKWITLLITSGTPWMVLLLHMILV